MAISQSILKQELATPAAQRLRVPDPQNVGPFFGGCGIQHHLF